MTLNPPSGNMYPWAYTTNPLGGRCKHGCNYCYVERLRKRGLKKYFGEPYLDERWFEIDLSIPEKGKMVFIQSCGDLFGEWIPAEWIKRILDKVAAFPETDFLLQTKNPRRFHDFNTPHNCILGTTIETNRDSGISKAPTPNERFLAMKRLQSDYRRMVSIEPIMDFDVEFFAWIRWIEPEFVSVGANSGTNSLPEPSPAKLQLLLKELGTFTEVRRKENLKRLEDR